MYDRPHLLLGTRECPFRGHSVRELCVGRARNGAGTGTTTFSRERPLNRRKTGVGVCMLAATGPPRSGSVKLQELRGTLVYDPRHIPRNFRQGSPPTCTYYGLSRKLTPVERSTSGECPARRRRGSSGDGSPAISFEFVSLVNPSNSNSPRSKDRDGSCPNSCSLTCKNH